MEPDRASPQRMSLDEAAALIEPGSLVTLGGNLLHRAPSAFARALASRGSQGLRLTKTAGAYDVDLLCAAGCVSEVLAGYIGFESEFGLAPGFRRGVESGKIRIIEHSCYSVIAGLRASACGIPFQPLTGLQGSDLPGRSGFQKVKSPYGAEEVYLIPAIRPDWAIVHVQRCDTRGNARILGTPFEDVLMTRAAQGVIVTAEEIVPFGSFAGDPENTQIPGFLVRAVVHAPGGAHPASCAPYYDYDAEAIRRYLDVASDRKKLGRYIEETHRRDVEYSKNKR